MILGPDGKAPSPPSDEAAFFGLRRDLDNAFSRQVFAGYVVLYDEHGKPLVTRPLEGGGLRKWLP